MKKVFVKQKKNKKLKSVMKAVDVIEAGQPDHMKQNATRYHASKGKKY